ncbi:MAG: recombinational DNA repair protein (RecE pathway) [Ruminococcaceae bacterium]|nr:recombinational DNA repair protein (RecE pathway) [Oscillospiraceae bacterium]
MAENTAAVAAAPKQQVSPSQRFANLVTREYASVANTGLEMMESQKRLVQHYFVKTDRVLEAAEQRRLAKSEKYRDSVPVTWQNIDMNALALDCAHYSKLGLDPMQKNHLHIIPYKNNKTGKYDINFMEGYVDLELIASKYAVEPPIAVTCELVYSNDKFTLHKKSSTNKVESYDLDVTDPFDRGDVKGGFGYIQYENPEKNVLVTLSLKDILKRKGAGQGNAEFWGGEKDKWENGKKVGKEHVEGWFEEMCLKTVKRCVFGGNYIPIDPAKVDDTYNHIKLRQQGAERMEAEQEIAENANKGDLVDVVDVEYSDVPDGVNPDTGEVTEPVETAPQDSAAGDGNHDEAF